MSFVESSPLSPGGSQQSSAALAPDVALMALDRQRRPGGWLNAGGRAVDALKAAGVRVRAELMPSGWELSREPTVRAVDHTVFRFAILRDGVVVSACAFVIGPDQTVVFERPAEPPVAGGLNTMDEAGIHRLIKLWVREVQAGIGNRWRYEAKMRWRG